MAQKAVECQRSGCKIRRIDSSMLYFVPDDKYFCSQKCADIHFGVKREEPEE